jgi:uncharacterized protein YjdB
MNHRMTALLCVAVFLAAALVPLVAADAAGDGETSPFTAVNASYAGGYVTVTGTVSADYAAAEVKAYIFNIDGTQLATSYAYPKNDGSFSILVSTGTLVPGTGYSAKLSVAGVGLKTCYAEANFDVTAAGIVSVTGVALDKGALSLTVGQTAALKATVSPDDATITAATWSSSDTKVATVADGTVSAVSVGTATITVKTADGGFTASCAVTVAARTAVSFASPTMTVITGLTAPISINVSGYAKDEIGVRVADTSVASVKTVSIGNGINDEIIVEGLKVGTTDLIIWVKSDESLSATCTVTVDPYVGTPCENYYFFIQFKEGFSQTTLTGVSQADMRAGFWVHGTGDNAARALKQVCTENGWQLSYDETFYEGWIDHFLGLGTTNHTDGSYTYWAQYSWDAAKETWTYNNLCLGYLDTRDSQYLAMVFCTTTSSTSTTADLGVTPADMPSDILVKDTQSVSLDCSAVSMAVGGTAKLTATVLPADAANKTVTWSSSDDSIATVSDGTVAGVKTGIATITVTTVDGHFKAACIVTVGAAGAVTGVTLDKVATVAADRTKQLTATVLPADAANKTVTWSSSDDSIATVSDGMVSGVKVGAAYITVTTVDGGFTAVCHVSVYREVDVTGILLDASEANVSLHGTMTLVATFSPADATETAITWSSSDESVATVDNGVVSGLSVGTATITAVSANGLKAFCTVNVADGTVKDSSISNVFNADGSVTTARSLTVERSDGTVVSEIANITVKDGKTVSQTDVRSVSVVGKTTVTVTASDESTGVSTRAEAVTTDGKTVGTATISVPSSDSVSATAMAAVAAQAALVKNSMPSVNPIISVSSTGRSVTLPTAALKDSGASIEISMAGGKLLLPAAADEKLVAAGSNITFSIENVDKSTLTTEQRRAVGNGVVYSITAVGTSVVHDIGGMATVILPFVPEKDQSTDGITVWYMDSDGVMTEVPCKYDAATSTVSFQTSHLSDYVVKAVSTADGSMPDAWIWVIAVLIFGIVAVGLVYPKLHGKRPE